MLSQTIHIHSPSIDYSEWQQSLLTQIKYFSENCLILVNQLITLEEKLTVELHPCWPS